MLSIALQIAKNAVADRRGVTAMEYGLIAGVLAAGIVAGFTTLSGKLSGAFINMVF